MLSLRPSTTGVYGLRPSFRTLPEFKDRVTLNQHFALNGYETYTAGKVYHGSIGRKKDEFDHIGPPGRPGIKPETKLIPPTPGGNHPLMDWGVFDHADEDKGDWQVASWAVEQLESMPTEKPFFMAAGFFLPHVPCHVPPRWWDLYDHDSIVMPPIRKNDRLDCSPMSWYLHWDLPEPRLSWLTHHDQHRNLVHSYLSSISFTDHQVGRVLDALEKSPHADNTIICLWSDHGWHLGEKNITGKNTLWRHSTRVPLIFAGPGVESLGSTVSPAELLDIYPTLCDLAGIPIPANLEGVSLRPQIKDPTLIRKRPAITDHNPGNQSVVDHRYRLIRYADESEELYDTVSDPFEYENLSGQSKFAKVVDRLRSSLQMNPAPLAKGSASRTLEKVDGKWIWEGEAIDPDHPPMNIAPNKPEDLPRRGS